MLEAILEAQEDVKGGAPSYLLKADTFNQLSALLLKYGYISKPIAHEIFTGGKL